MKTPDLASSDPDVMEMYSIKQSFWQRWLPVFIAIAVILIFLVYHVFFTAPRVERVSGPIAGSGVAVKLPIAAEPKEVTPPVDLPVVEVKKAAPTEAPKVQKAEDANAASKPKKIEPAKPKVSDEDADDDAWLNGND